MRSSLLSRVDILPKYSPAWVECQPVSPVRPRRSRLLSFVAADTFPFSSLPPALFCIFMPRPPHPDSAAPDGAEHGPFACFHPITTEWFKAVFDEPTAPQRMGWPVIARGESALILAPTGTGKTLSAFLWCLDRLMLHPRPAGRKKGTRIVYVSPLKALAVDVERNLRSPLAGMANMARRMGVSFREPTISVRTGDTPQRERARYRREPSDILITTPESLYLLLTSQAADALRTVDTVIVDEIHALVPTKRGAHLALSLERLEALVKKPLQRIGLSATQRPLEEVARFLGGVEIQGREEQGPGTRDQKNKGRNIMIRELIQPKRRRRTGVRIFAIRRRCVIVR